METTWLESSDTGYDRVIVLNFVVDYDAFNYPPWDTITNQELRNKIAEKLEDEMGLLQQTDYVFTEFKDTSQRHTPAFWSDNPRIVIRLKDEEHFTMFKLHYHG